MKVVRADTIPQSVNQRLECVFARLMATEAHPDKSIMSESVYNKVLHTNLGEGRHDELEPTLESTEKKILSSHLFRF